MRGIVVFTHRKVLPRTSSITCVVCLCLRDPLVRQNKAKMLPKSAPRLSRVSKMAKSVAEGCFVALFSIKKGPKCRPRVQGIIL